MGKKKNDGWFFSKSLLDEIYQLPLEEEIDLETEEELHEPFPKKISELTLESATVSENKKGTDSHSFPESLVKTGEDGRILYVKAPSVASETNVEQVEREQKKPDNPTFSLEEQEGKLLYQVKKK
ncbi:hypothetical protein [Enterococcus mundtii]|uniref:Uncharacterized protein n=1 Tax=Enterococcus mundtii TaxID=53346 RepID=A0A2S7RT92_ENTMU|nr:hypothetical protein [Enterococcus mundtii]PQF22903.1 hypothetical protein CUS89_09330 [Enterococcus mundtii]